MSWQDLTIHDDMYKYFKSEQLGDMNWICGLEGAGGGMGCNGGAPLLQTSVIINSSF